MADFQRFPIPDSGSGKCCLFVSDRELRNECRAKQELENPNAEGAAAQSCRPQEDSAD
jgi:hypothetical protein